MKIEIYRFTKHNQESNTKAFVDFIIEGNIIIKGFRLMEGTTGLFLASPRSKDKSGQFYDKIRFQNPETKQYLEKLALNKYNEVNNG